MARLSSAELEAAIMELPSSDHAWTGVTHTLLHRDDVIALIRQVTTSGLDVERLGRAMDLCGIGVIDDHEPSRWAVALAAEYDRLTAQAEHPTHDLSGHCWCQPLVEEDLATGDRLFIHRRGVDSPHIEADPAYWTCPTCNEQMPAEDAVGHLCGERP